MADQNDPRDYASHTAVFPERLQDECFDPAISGSSTYLGSLNLAFEITPGSDEHAQNIPPATFPNIPARTMGECFGPSFLIAPTDFDSPNSVLRNVDSERNTRSTSLTFVDSAGDAFPLHKPPFPQNRLGTATIYAAQAYSTYGSDNDCLFDGSYFHNQESTSQLTADFEFLEKTRHETNSMERSMDRIPCDSPWAPECSEAVQAALRRFSPGSATRSTTLWSPFSINTLEHELADSTSKRMMTTDFLGSYRSIFERPLSCWVTEANCPYLGYGGAPINSSIPESTPAGFSPSSITFVQRVKSLDTALESLRHEPLQPFQYRAATKALKTTILAFASQWTPAKSRQRITFSRVPSTAHSTSSANKSPFNIKPNLDVGSSSDFERLVQQSLWNEARRCLDDCADLDSFRVILAQLLFPITQKVVEDQEFSQIQEKISSSTDREFEEKLRRAALLAPDETSLGCSSNIFANLRPGSLLDPLSATPDLDLVIKSETNGRHQRSAFHKLLLWKKRTDSLPLVQCHNKHLLNFNMLFWWGVMVDNTVAVLV